MRLIGPTTGVALGYITFSTTVIADTVLSSRDAHELCTTAEMHWVDFCNGLIQGYADFLTAAEIACFPSGTTRTTLVTIFTDQLPNTQAYADDDLALLAAVEIFGRVYQCGQ